MHQSGYATNDVIEFVALEDGERLGRQFVVERKRDFWGDVEVIPEVNETMVSEQLP